MEGLFWRVQDGFFTHVSSVLNSWAETVPTHSLATVEDWRTGFLHRAAGLPDCSKDQKVEAAHFLRVGRENWHNITSVIL